MSEPHFKVKEYPTILISQSILNMASNEYSYDFGKPKKGTCHPVCDF
jgi:hypothetical protein